MSKITWYEVEKEELPDDEPFLAILGGEVGLCEYSEVDDEYYFVSYPAYAYSIMRLSETKLDRITHWAYLPVPPFEEEYEF